MTVRTIRSALVCFALALALPAAAGAAETDPTLEQKLADLSIVHGTRVLTKGHIDIGPKLDDGQWRLLVHDDVAKADAGATSVWRYPNETVFHVLDGARLSAPDDPNYRFTGARPGQPLWVVPQTQNPGVVWLGWNTQDPNVMRTIDRGVTLSLTGVQGPGIVTVYLQSGSFGKPQVLWDSRKRGLQPLWVDVNTHTHANWVFTQPGVYLLRLRAEADLRDGSHVSDSQFLRLAVGTKTSPDEALTARWNGPAEPKATAAPGDGTAAPAGVDDGAVWLVPALVAAIAIVAVGLIGGFAVAIIRGQRARRQVLGHPESRNEHLR